MSCFEENTHSLFWFSVLVLCLSLIDRDHDVLFVLSMGCLANNIRNQLKRLFLVLGLLFNVRFSSPN